MMRKTMLTILMLLIVLLPFHPFFSTWLNNIFFDPTTAPHFLLASWKEVLILIFAVLFIIQIIRKKIPFPIFDWLDIVILIFCLWSVTTGLWWTGDIGVGENFDYNQLFDKSRLFQILLGIKYGLEFLIFFFLVKHFPLTKREKETLFHLALASAAVTIVFGLLQKYLPQDFLVNFGYSAPPPFGGNLNEPISYCQKISNTEICRVQSTFSGPNQFGAYLLFILPLLFFFAQSIKDKLIKSIYYFLLIIGLAVLFWTFSRGAWLGAIFGFIAAFIYVFKDQNWFHYLSIKIGAFSVFLLFLASLIAQEEILMEGDGLFHGQLFMYLHSTFFWFLIAIFAGIVYWIFYYYKNYPAIFFITIINAGCFMIFMISKFWGEFFWQVLLRPSSTQGHWERSRDGIHHLLENPWGLGLGDAGPASHYNSANALGFIPENYFLQVGLESGFLGLLLFILILILLGHNLLKADTIFSIPMAIGLLGICFHSLFLHSWESAAMGLSFWGLAAIALDEEKKVSFRESISGFWQRFLLLIRNKI